VCERYGISMKALYVVLFQVGWFACVLGGAHDAPFLGSAIALALIALHLWRAERRRAEFVVIGAAALLGLSTDSLWVSLSFVRYTSGVVVEGTAPVWIVAMWMLFAATINMTFTWLRGRVVLAASLGAVLGPLAYRGGAGLGAAEFVAPDWRALVALAITWGIAMPLLVAVATRANQAQTASVNSRAPGF